MIKNKYIFVFLPETFEELIISHGKAKSTKNTEQSVRNKNKDDQEGITLDKKDGTYQDHEGIEFQRTVP